MNYFFQEIFSGPSSSSVFDKGLVTESVKWKDIIKYQAEYYSDSSKRSTEHMVLAYVTPVSYIDKIIKLFLSLFN